MRKIKVRPTIRIRRYSEETDDFIETSIRLFGDVLLGAMLTLAGVLLSNNGTVSELFADLTMTLGCVVLTLSVCLLLGYMFVTVFGRTCRRRKDCNDEI